MVNRLSCGRTRQGLAGLSGLLLVLMVWGQVGAGEKINCDIHHGPCSQVIENITVVLDIQPKPVKAMQDLLFRVSLTGVSPGKPPHIDLGMPGMKMGPNRVSLKPAGDGAYEGTGVIVRCPSGRRTWYARVAVPGVGPVEFVFDVVY